MQQKRALFTFPCRKNKQTAVKLTRAHARACKGALAFGAPASLGQLVSCV